MPIQIWTSSTAIIAATGVPNQLTSLLNIRLMSPKSVLNMSRQTSSIANDGMA